MASQSAAAAVAAGAPAAGARASSSKEGKPAVSRVDRVQLDGLVLMKIMKHARENPQEAASGSLLGMVSKSTLEITNCFAFPRSTDESDGSGESYQLEMMRCLRDINVDHMQVGWYQSSFLGSHLTEDLIQAQFAYQKTIEESIVLVYDPIRTTAGSLSLHAYRLTPVFMAMYGAKNFSPDMVRDQKLSVDKIVEEVPIVVHSSLLTTALVNELQEDPSIRSRSTFSKLDFSAQSYLESNVRMLMSQVDALNNETQEYNTFLRNLSRYRHARESFLQQRKSENAQRKAEGLPELPEDDPSRYPSITPISRLNSLLITGQIDSYCSQISQYASHSYGKLFLAKALHDE